MTLVSQPGLKFPCNNYKEINYNNYYYNNYLGLKKTKNNKHNNYYCNLGLQKIQKQQTWKLFIK